MPDRPTPNTNPAHRAAAAAATLAALLLPITACVPDGPQPRPKPQLRNFEQPPDLKVGNPGFAVDTTPEDTDNNGFFDTWSITVLLFAQDQRQYPRAFTAPGKITFTLTAQDRTTLARWRIPLESLDDNRFSDFIGDGYRFDLSLADADLKPNTDNPARPPDRLAPTMASLAMTYHPPGDDTDPIPASRALSIRVGPTGL